MIIYNGKEYAHQPALLKELSQPLCDYLYEFGCPHDVIVIDMAGVQHCSGECAAPFELRD